MFACISTIVPIFKRGIKLRITCMSDFLKGFTNLQVYASCPFKTPCFVTITERIIYCLSEMLRCKNI